MDSRLQVVIGAIRARPGMYLGKPSVVRLSAFLDGYFCALLELKSVSSFPPELEEFRDWIAEQYSVTESIGWEQVLVNAAGSDHDGFRLFEQLWDEFESMRQAAN